MAFLKKPQPWSSLDAQAEQAEMIAEGFGGKTRRGESA